jgi:hypothetical protein
MRDIEHVFRHEDSHILQDQVEESVRRQNAKLFGCKSILRPKNKSGNQHVRQETHRRNVKVWCVDVVFGRNSFSIVRNRRRPILKSKVN